MKPSETKAEVATDTAVVTSAPLPVATDTKAEAVVKAIYADLFAGYSANAPTVKVTSGDDHRVEVLVSGAAQAVKKAAESSIKLPEGSQLLIHQTTIGVIEISGDVSSVTITHVITAY